MNFHLRCKVWLENETGKPILGEGRMKIFAAIRQTGSIVKAARMLGLQYRNAWAKIKDAERQCGFKIVETNRQGSKLTPAGQQLLRKYFELQRSCTRSAQAKFRKLFSEGETTLDSGEHKDLS